MIFLLQLFLFVLAGSLLLAGILVAISFLFPKDSALRAGIRTAAAKTPAAGVKLFNSVFSWFCWLLVAGLILMALSGAGT